MRQFIFHLNNKKIISKIYYQSIFSYYSFSEIYFYKSLTSYLTLYRCFLYYSNDAEILSKWFPNASSAVIISAFKTANSCVIYSFNYSLSLS